MIKTISVLPPKIFSAFRRSLLTTFDMLGIRKRAYDKLIIKAQKRHKEGTKQNKKIMELASIFEAIYEWLKAEKAYTESEEKDPKKRPLPPIEKLNRLDGVLGKDVRDAFRSCSASKFWGNGVLQEIQK